MSSLTEYPLRDALWHAAQAFSAVKTVVITKRIILFTCEDNPLVDDPAERHRIRTRVSTFKNLDIDFRVIGLKNGFDHNRFYKELEIISSGMSPQTYKPLKLEDLEAEIQFPSRTISNISWMFSNDVVVPVSIFTVATLVFVKIGFGNFNLFSLYFPKPDFSYFQIIFFNIFKLDSLNFMFY